MKEDKIKDFMKLHQQKMGDDGFTKKLFPQLDVYPAPQKTSKKPLYITLIVPACVLLAIILVAVLGGWDVLLSNMKYTRLNGMNPLWYVLSSVILTFLSGLTLFTLNWKETY